MNDNSYKILSIVGLVFVAGLLVWSLLYYGPKQYEKGMQGCFLNYPLEEMPTIEEPYDMPSISEGGISEGISRSGRVIEKNPEGLIITEDILGQDNDPISVSLDGDTKLLQREYQQPEFNSDTSNDLNNNGVLPSVIYQDTIISFDDILVGDDISIFVSDSQELYQSTIIAETIIKNIE